MNKVMVKEKMASWLAEMPSEVREVLFRGCCTVSLEGETKGDRNVTHWRQDVIVVSVDDGGDYEQSEWEFPAP